MDLRTYLKRNHIKPSVLANILCVSRSYVYLLLVRKRSPSLHVANQISQLTKGDVRMGDMERR